VPRESEVPHSGFGPGVSLEVLLSRGLVKAVMESRFVDVERGSVDAGLKITKDEYSRKRIKY